MKKCSIIDVIPFLGREDQVFILRDGRVAVMFKVIGYQYESLSERKIIELNQKVKAFINDLPDYANIQKIDVYYKKESSLEFDDSFIGSELKKAIRERDVLEIKSYISLQLIPDHLKKKTNPMGNFFSKSGLYLGKDPFKGIDRRKQEAATFGEDLKKLIESIEGCIVSSVDEKEYEEFLFQYLNLDFNTNYGGLVNMIDSSNEEVLKIGDKLVSVVSYVEQGEYFCDTQEKRYIGENSVNHPFSFGLGLDLGFEHITVTNLRKYEKDTGLKPFQKEVTVNKNLPDIPIFNNVRMRAMVVQQFFDDVAQSSDSLVDVSIQVIIWGRSSSERNEKVGDAVRGFKKMANGRGVVESYDAANLFFCCQPLNGSEVYRSILMPADFACGYLNFEGNYRSDQKGELLCDRFGEYNLVDLSHEMMNSKNAILIGPSGSGKSFSEGYFIAQGVIRNEIQVIIDKGGTYKNLIAALGGVYFEHTEESPFKVNPFQAELDKNGNYIIDDDKILLIRTFIAILWKNKENEERFSTLESSVLTELIPMYYKSASSKKEVPCLSNFAVWLNSIKDNKEIADEHLALRFDFNNLLIVMKPYTEGIYANILNNQESMSLTDNKLICFDLESLQRDKTLYPVVTMLLIDLILQHIKKNKKIMKRIILDEAWSFFSGDMAEFIGYMYRTIRKNNGSVTVITQSANDIKECAVGKELVINTALFIILNHTGQNVELLKEVFTFEDSDIKMVNSLRKDWEMDRYLRKKGGRELFIKRIGVDSKVYALEVPDVIYPLLTSHPKEREHFNELQKKYDFNRAIFEFVQNRRAKVV
jgi:hypothetical protein